MFLVLVIVLGNSQECSHLWIRWVPHLIMEKIIGYAVISLLSLLFTFHHQYIFFYEAVFKPKERCFEMFSRKLFFLENFSRQWKFHLMPNHNCLLSKAFSFEYCLLAPLTTRNQQRKGNKYLHLKWQYYFFFSKIFPVFFFFFLLHKE